MPRTSTARDRIGPVGQRVRHVMSELSGEKIDIVDHSDDPAEMIAHALSPAGSPVEIDANAKAARVRPDINSLE